MVLFLYDIYLYKETQSRFSLISILRHHLFTPHSRFVGILATSLVQSTEILISEGIVSLVGAEAWVCYMSQGVQFL